MNNIPPRIGFACKWIDFPNQVNGIKASDDCKRYNTNITTLAKLNRQDKKESELDLALLMKNNLANIFRLIKRVGDLPENQRILRLTSDILPMYSHPSWSYFWKDSSVQKYLEQSFKIIGDYSREKNIRLSFHPGHFCVLGSDSTEVLNNSILEVEYHADMIRLMGYGKVFQDFKLNVHIAGRKGPQGIKDVLGKLSTEARNCLTIENDENSWGIDDSLELANHCALVLDIHHNWINTGEYITSDDDRCKKIIDSWKGVRPVIHYSISREDLLINHDINTKPDLNVLLSKNYKKQKLRAHSDFYWNNACNTWAFSFLDNFDIICEAKAKNLASSKLIKEVF